jgi:hypothetical protein
MHGWLLLQIDPYIIARLSLKECLRRLEVAILLFQTKDIDMHWLQDAITSCLEKGLKYWHFWIFMFYLVEWKTALKFIDMAQSSTQNILAGLDLSSMDAYILSFLSQHHKALTTEKVFFIHVDENLSAGSESGPERQSSDTPGEEIAKELSDKIRNSIPKTIVDYAIRVVRGDPENEISIKHY